VGTLELRLPLPRRVLRVADRSDGLESGPAFPALPAGRVLVNPHVVVTRAVAV
jgi:hypothetical protein